MNVDDTVDRFLAATSASRSGFSLHARYGTNSLQLQEHRKLDKKLSIRRIRAGFIEARKLDELDGLAISKVRRDDECPQLVSGVAVWLELNGPGEELDELPERLGARHIVSLCFVRQIYPILGVP